MTVLLSFLVVVVGLLGGTILLAVALARARMKAERRRRDMLHAWSMANGWQMHEGDVPVAWRNRFADLRRFQIRRLATGPVRGLPVTAADCRYEIESTDSEGRPQTTVVDLTVFVARLPGRWPDIEVRERNIGSRLLRALGRSSRIEIGHPLFDQRFRVEAADPRAAYAMLSPALVDAHLRGHVPAWSLRDGELVTAERGRLEPAHIGAGAERLAWLAGLIGYRG